MIEIYLDHKFQWPQEGLNCESLGYEVGLGNYFVSKRFAVQTLMWSLEFVIHVNLEHDTIAVWNLARSWSISKKYNIKLNVEVKRGFKQEKLIEDFSLCSHNGTHEDIKG